MSGLWYLATPYTRYEGGLSSACGHACKAAAVMIERGFRIFSPIAHSHMIAVRSNLDPLNHDLWLDQDQPFMDAACGLFVVRMTGWNDSAGVTKEIAEFRRQGKPVYFLSYPDLKLVDQKPRLMVLGSGRHGKDSVCEILRDRYGFTFESSSHFVAERAVRPYLATRGVTYSSFDEMYADRVNRRAEWFTAISEYNSPDAARLGREIYQEFDIYCGIRNQRELIALQRDGVVQHTMWVDASKRLPPEPVTSITVTARDADCVIDNNGTIDELSKNVNEAVQIALLSGWSQREMRLAA